MKPLITTFACALALALSLSARAAESKEKEKEKEIKGEGLCLKCELKKSDSCQNVIRVKEKDGKETLYWLDKNDVSTAFHKHICTGPQKVTAKGTLKKEADKKIGDLTFLGLVVSKIDLDEKK